MPLSKTNVDLTTDSQLRNELIKFTGRLVSLVDIHGHGPLRSLSDPARFDSARGVSAGAKKLAETILKAVKASQKQMPAPTPDEVDKVVRTRKELADISSRCVQVIAMAASRKA